MIKCPICTHRLIELDRQVRRIQTNLDAAEKEVQAAVAQRISDLDACESVARALAAANARNVQLHEANVDLIARLAQSEEEKRTMAASLLDQVRRLLTITDEQAPTIKALAAVEVAPS